MKNKKIPVINEEMELTFQHLYDNNYGVIANERHYGKAALVMIMPTGFIPRIGKSYTCVIAYTRGNFIYKNRQYKLYIARRKDKGTFLDEINHCIEQETTKGEFRSNQFSVLEKLELK